MQKLIMKINREKAAWLSVHCPCRMKKIGIDKYTVSLLQQIFAFLDLKIDLSLRHHQDFKLLMPVKIKDRIRAGRIAHFMQSDRKLDRAVLLLFFVLLFPCHPYHLRIISACRLPSQTAYRQFLLL